MRGLGMIASIAALPLVLATAEIGGQEAQVPSTGGAPDAATVEATVVATGIPGAGAITQIGTFHTGGPFHDRAAFAAETKPKHVLERTRLFVASTSNFGAPLALAQPEGSILSLDVSGDPIEVPEDFAAGGGQASALDSKIILYTAQSPAFLNRVNNSGLSVKTSGLTAVSLPLGISLNNGFGRPWFANAPNGSDGDGTITVNDPSGAPLAAAPDPVAGGVFAGTVTNRNPAALHGLTAAAVATALVTKSSDGTGRAVFLAALAEGSVVQVHVQKGVNEFAPAGSFTPIAGIDTQAAESSDPSAVTRVGMLFNWVPARIVYVSDPLANRILALDLTDDGTLVHAGLPRYITSPALRTPIDIAAAVPEVAARNFASNTTLGGGSDFYVLNRGNNSVVRMTQDGDVVAVRHIVADVDDFRVNGLAVSEDARTIWVTATAPGRQGFVMKIPTFGAGAVTTSMIEHAKSVAADGAAKQGADMFAHDLTPQTSLGPLFNGESCNSCHNTPAPGGMGTDPDSFVTRVARIGLGTFDPLVSHGGPIARQHSIGERGVSCGLPTGVPPQANARSRRSAMTLRGTSLIDNILLRDILAARDAEPAAVRGRVNDLPDGRAGRFGWKAQTATLVEFMGEAFRDETGLTNPLAPRDLVRGCGASITKPEADAAPLTSIVAFLNTIDPPVPSSACLTSPGSSLFTSVAIGCANCHKPSYSVPGSGLSPLLYSDLLLHDMGLNLADGFEQGSASGREFRTAPLWRVADRQHFLHDGRASSILDAILEHGGQATSSVLAFQALGQTDRQMLLAFLNCI